MKLRDTLICWTAAWVPGMRPEARDTPGVKIGPYPANGWDREWQRSDGACWVDWRDVTEDQRLQRLLVLFTVLTTRDLGSTHPSCTTSS